MKLTKEYMQKTFSVRFKAKREALNIGKMEMAQRLEASEPGTHITHTTIWNYEEGNNMPSLITLHQISDIFGVTIDWLIGRTDKENCVVISGQDVPMELRKQSVDAVELLRSQVDADGGLTQEAREAAMRIALNAKILKYAKPRKSKLSSDKPPSDSE